MQNRNIPSSWDRKQADARIVDTARNLAFCSNISRQHSRCDICTTICCSEYYTPRKSFAHCRPFYPYPC